MLTGFIRFGRTLLLLTVFGGAAVTATFYIVSRMDELAEDRLLPGGQSLPPPKPFASRYSRWVRTVVGSGFTDFGQSNKIVVKNVLADRLPVTATVGFTSWLLTWGLGLASAMMLTTVWRRRLALYQGHVYPVAQAVPSLVVVIVFYLILLQVEPNSSRWLRMVMGIASLVALATPATTALWVNGIDRVLDREFVRVLRARGVGPLALWGRHILPNVLASSGVITQAVFSLGGLVVGSAFVEGVFRLGGVAESFIEGTRYGHAELCAFATLMYFLVTAAGVLAGEVVVIWLDPDGEASREIAAR
jgi:peptide/nickel transport system permease protein